MTQRPRPAAAEPAQRAKPEPEANHAPPIDKLIQRAVSALGPPHDGAAELNNIAFAKRLVAVLLAFHLIHIHRDRHEQDDDGYGD